MKGMRRPSRPRWRSLQVLITTTMMTLMISTAVPVRAPMAVMDGGLDAGVHKVEAEVAPEHAEKDVEKFGAGVGERADAPGFMGSRRINSIRHLEIVKREAEVIATR